MDLFLPSESTDIPESSTTQSVRSDDDKNSISDLEYLKSNPALKTVVNFVGIKTVLTSGRDIRKPSRLLAYLMLSVESAIDDIRNSTVYRTDLAHARDAAIYELRGYFLRRRYPYKTMVRQPWRKYPHSLPWLCAYCYTWDMPELSPSTDSDTDSDSDIEDIDMEDIPELIPINSDSDTDSD